MFGRISYAQKTDFILFYPFVYSIIFLYNSLLDFILAQERVSYHSRTYDTYHTNITGSQPEVKTLKKIQSSPARVACGLLSFLAITSWSASFNSNMPKVSYTRAIDIWSVSSFVFVFISLIEYPIATGIVLKVFSNIIFYFFVRPNI